MGSDTLRAVASEATGAERDRLFATQAERSPQFADYQRNTPRQIPVMVLEPAG